MSIGLASLIVPGWFSNFFTYSGSSSGLKGLTDAIVLVVETSYAISVFISVSLHMIMPESKEKQEAILMHGTDVLPTHHQSHSNDQSIELAQGKKGAAM